MHEILAKLDVSVEPWETSLTASIDWLVCSVGKMKLYTSQLDQREILGVIPVLTNKWHYAKLKPALLKQGLESWKTCTLSAPSDFQSIPHALTNVRWITFKSLSSGDISLDEIYITLLFSDSLMRANTRATITWNDASFDILLDHHI